MKFLIDANLPPALAEWLGPEHDVLHVGTILGQRALDISIWREAAAAGRIILTKDADFVRLALADDAGPQVVFVRCGNLSLRPFRVWFAALAPQMVTALTAGERIVELA